MKKLSYSSVIWTPSIQSILLAWLRTHYHAQLLKSQRFIECRTGNSGNDLMIRKQLLKQRKMKRKWDGCSTARKKSLLQCFIKMALTLEYMKVVNLEPVFISLSQHRKLIVLAIRKEHAKSKSYVPKSSLARAIQLHRIDRLKNLHIYRDLVLFDLTLCDQIEEEETMILWYTIVIRHIHIIWWLCLLKMRESINQCLSIPSIEYIHDIIIECTKMMKTKRKKMVIIARVMKMMRMMKTMMMRMIVSLTMIIEVIKKHYDGYIL